MGLRHGKGSWHPDAGEWQDYLYVGEQVAGRPHGTGTLTFAEGGSYIGQFHDGDFEGDGQIYYPGDHLGGHEGGSYAGQFSRGFRHGKGEHQSGDGSRRYSGQWEDQVPHGEGTSERRWDEGAADLGDEGVRRWVYVGEHVGGQRAGASRCTFVADAPAETSEHVAGRAASARASGARPSRPEARSSAGGRATSSSTAPASRRRPAAARRPSAGR